jgi:hypothetical protein
MVEVVKDKIKCACCKRILAYDLEDIQTKTRTYNTYDGEDYEQIKYITCPICKYDNRIL